MIGIDIRIGDDVFATLLSRPSLSRRRIDVICVPVLFSPSASPPARTSASKVVNDD